MVQEYQRMTDKTHKPTKEEILDYIGKKPSRAWTALTQFLEENYNIQPETVFYGVNYGWLVRYRKSGKTLCSLFPEKNAFSVLIVLGAKQADKALQMHDELSSQIIKDISNTKQLHDGRWLWIRVLAITDINDVKSLLPLKRKPRKS